MDILSNSFYYFFSAVPQVLGAVLALFAVFVLFKIQEIKDELIAIASDLIKLLESISFSLLDEKEARRLGRLEVTNKAIKVKNIYLLKFFADTTVNYVDDDKLHTSIAESIKVSYKEKFFLHQFILRSVIGLTIFTASVILLSLSIIPFGFFFLHHPVLLYVVFGLTILAVAGCFIGLIIILKLALKKQFIFEKDLIPEKSLTPVTRKSVNHK